MVEQHEAANEELQAANEEVQSANEELQSINEELETSKEELESANEELTTVNEEMSYRNAELNLLNDDLVNLQTSTKLSIILVGRDLKIRRFSPQAEKQFDLLATDVGRPVSHIRHGLTVETQYRSRGTSEQPAVPVIKHSPLDLESLISEVIRDIREHEQEAQDRSGRWHSVRVRPYMTLDNKIDGAVLLLVDIDALKSAERTLTAARDYARNMVETVREPLLVLDRDFRVESANRAFYNSFQSNFSDIMDASFFDISNGRWDIVPLRTLLEEVFTHNNPIEGFHIEFDFPRAGKRFMLLNARRIEDPFHPGERILIALEDITERERSVNALRESEARFRVLFDLGPVAVYSCNKDGLIQEFNICATELWGRKPRLGDKYERFCGSHKMYRPDGAYMAHEECPMAQVLSGKMSEVRDGEVVIERPDGTRVTVVVNIRPITNQRGEITGAINCFYDITERKAAEETLRIAEERFRTLVSVITDVPWTADENGAFTVPQPAWSAFTGQSWEEQRGFGWSNAIHSEDRERVLYLWENARKNHSVHRAEGRLWHAPTGIYRYFEARATPLLHPDGTLREWVGSCTDVHDRRSAEVERNMHHMEIDVLNRRLQRAMAETHHRVKNNLQVISALIDMQVMKHGRNVPTGELRRIWQHVRALATIHDLLTKAAKEDGDIHTIDPAEIVQELAPLLKSVLGTEEIRFEVESFPLLLRHGTALAVLINELVSNAVKHGKGAVYVSLAVVSDRARLEVCDEGPGFPVGFDARMAGNTGLGLIENLAYMDLRGQTSYENRKDGGACVRIEFPLPS